MGDTLKEVGRKIGRSQRDVEILKRRGGYLPQVERTRGIVSATSSFLAPFVANEADRKLSLSLNFFEKIGGGGCEFGEIEDYVQCEISWGVPYPYGSDVGEAKLWYGTADYPPDGVGYPGGVTNSQGPQNFISNTGEFSLANGGVRSSRAGFYLVEHHIAPTGVSVSASTGWVNGIRLNGTLKSQRAYTVPNGHVAPPLGSASILLSGDTRYGDASTIVRAVVQLTSSADLITFHLTATGVAFFTEPNFAGAPPHTFITLIGNPN